MARAAHGPDAGSPARTRAAFEQHVHEALLAEVLGGLVEVEARGVRELRERARGLRGRVERGEV